MSKAACRKNLVAVKHSLAAKYASLAKSANSAAKRQRYLFHCERYRRQAARLGGD